MSDEAVWLGISNSSLKSELLAAHQEIERLQAVNKSLQRQLLDLSVNVHRPDPQ